MDDRFSSHATRNTESPIREFFGFFNFYLFFYFRCSGQEAAEAPGGRPGGPGRANGGGRERPGHQGHLQGQAAAATFNLPLLWQAKVCASSRSTRIVEAAAVVSCRRCGYRD